MTQKGPHTWDMFLEYHRCPACGYIVENRNGYTSRFGKYEKSLECPRCKKAFVESKKNQPTFGPLIGDAQPPEVEWN